MGSCINELPASGGLTNKRSQTLEFQTKYRVLKTSWGIAIDITGLLLDTTADKNVLAVSEKGLTSDQKNQITLGLESILNKIPADKKYNIDIQKVWFNPCDFQTEGLFWASRDWISKALDIKTSEPEISYDKTQNKYFFRLADT